VPLHEKVENRENRLSGFVIFILRYKFDLFEIFVIYLIYFVFFLKPQRKGGLAGMVCDEKQHRADGALWRVPRLANE
jgi:hypothetical protein